jgi:hypothetical protein
MIVGYAFVAAIVLGVIAGIFELEILGIICGVVFAIVLAVVFIPAIISLFKK